MNISKSRLACEPAIFRFRDQAHFQANRYLTAITLGNSYYFCNILNVKCKDAGCAGIFGGGSAIDQLDVMIEESADLLRRERQSLRDAAGLGAPLTRGTGLVEVDDGCGFHG